MKQFTQEQQERAIDILTRVLKNEGWHDSEVAKLLDEVKPKILVVLIQNQTTVSYLKDYSSTGLEWANKIEFAKNFNTISEARKSFDKVSKVAGWNFFILTE